MSHNYCAYTQLKMSLCFCHTQMWSLYKDPKGEHIFYGRAFPTTTVVRDHNEESSSYSVVMLQNRIQELEKAIEMASQTHADSPPPVPQVPALA